MRHADRMLAGENGRASVTDATVSQTVLGAVRDNAVRHGDRAAVRDTRRHLGFAMFAAVVPAAAAGLHRRGVRPGDVGAIHLAGACDFALALHAVTAAGAVPVPLPPGASVAELARVLTDSGARFLLTGGEPAAAALAATERSYVRQVFAFGDVPGATPFARLVMAGDVADGGAPEPPPVDIDPLRDVALRTFEPAEELTHADRLAGLYGLAGTVGLTDADVLVCRRADVPVPTWVGLIDLCLTHGATFAEAAGPDTAALLAAVADARATIVVVSPAELRALAFDHDTVPAPGLRLLVTGTADPEIVQACRTRHGWIAAPLS